MRHVRLIVLVALVVALGTASAAEPAASKLASLSFLIGNWEAVGSGKPGEPTGAFSFVLDLRGQVMVRRNHADYPASAGRPAARHEDLMVIYEAKPDDVRADYYDSEGHTIHYAAQAAGANECVFVSEASPGGPRFRLSYKLAAAGVLNGRFEIAPPGKPTEFGPYLAWVAHKAASGSVGK